VTVDPSEQRLQLRKECVPLKADKRSTNGNTCSWEGRMVDTPSSLDYRRQIWILRLERLRRFAILEIVRSISPLDFLDRLPLLALLRVRSLCELSLGLELYLVLSIASAASFRVGMHRKKGNSQGGQDILRIFLKNPPDAFKRHFNGKEDLK